MSYVISFECKNCGWDWLGGFAYCPNCRGSSIKVINYESVDEFTERLMLMELRQHTGFIILEEDSNEF